MARVDELFNYLQTPGLTDQQIAAEIGRLGVTAQEVSQLTGVPVADVQSRLTAAAPVVAPTQQLFNYLQTPNLTDQQIAAEIGRLGVTAQEVSQLTGVPVADIQSRLTAAAPVVTPPAVVRPPVAVAPVVTPVVTPPVVRPPVVTPPANNISTFTNFLQTPGLTDQQIAAEMNRLGITAGQVSGLTGVSQNDVQTRFNATAPFSNATQGFAQNFNNYTSIPIGSQYNPAVTAGGASPYSQIMGQMRPVGNPYAGVVGNLSMGGYDPALYERIAAANLARDVAAKSGVTLADYYGAGAADSSADAAAATAADSAAAAAASATGTAPGSDGTPGSGAAMGGLITNVFGPDPAGPDEGQVNMMRGEYVIRKSSVNKYGKGLLDMINEGKVPAKKMKSLLG